MASILYLESRLLKHVSLHYNATPFPCRNHTFFSTDSGFFLILLCGLFHVPLFLVTFFSGKSRKHNEGCGTIPFWAVLTARERMHLTWVSCSDFLNLWSFLQTLALQTFLSWSQVHVLNTSTFLLLPLPRLGLTQCSNYYKTENCTVFKI